MHKLFVTGEGKNVQHDRHGSETWLCPFEFFRELFVWRKTTSQLSKVMCKFYGNFFLPLTTILQKSPVVAQLQKAQKKQTFNMIHKENGQDGGGGKNRSAVCSVWSPQAVQFPWWNKSHASLTMFINFLHEENAFVACPSTPVLMCWSWEKERKQKGFSYKFTCTKSNRQTLNFLLTTAVL